MPPDTPGRDKVFNLLYGVDSLQDSLRVAEIDSAYRQVLAEEKLNIPFPLSEQKVLRLTNTGLTR